MHHCTHPPSMVMSVLSHTILLWVLLASTENVTNARHGPFKATAVKVQDENPSQHSDRSNKQDGHKMNLTDAQGASRLQAASFSIRKSSHRQYSRNNENEEVRVMAIRNKRYKHSSRKKTSHRGKGTKATYRVPHRNHEDQQQSFTLDYSPPKVHPPHHN